MDAMTTVAEQADGVHPGPERDNGRLDQPSSATSAGPAAGRRVVLKLSGESFGGGRIGVDPDTVQSLAAPSCRSVAWTAAGPTTWACSAPS
jgi:hypothetical protein